MEYIRECRAPKCIFHNRHKTLNNLFSLNPAVSCVADKPASHCELYTSFSILLHFHLGVCHFFFSHGCVYMGQRDFISSIFVKIVFKIILEVFHKSHVTDV